MKSQHEVKKAKFIYNIHAGGKRRLNPLQTRVTLEEIKALFAQYQIPVDYFPTKYAKHATKLARESVIEKYDLVIAAGGDGTVGEVINGLVGTEMTVGILPLGSVMNVARMLSIPLNVEQAVQLIKIRRVRKIDVGSITKIEGEKMEQPYYFLEQAGIGLDASMHYYTSKLYDQRNILSVVGIIKTFFSFFGHSAKVQCDDEKIETNASMVTISNGPLGGAALELAPDAKLNDHKLTVSEYKMNRLELSFHIISLFLRKKGITKKVITTQAQKVKITSETAKMVHADARLFGTTPVEFKVVPNALNIITGFPKKGTSSFNKRTYLDL